MKFLISLFLLIFVTTSSLGNEKKETVKTKQVVVEKKEKESSVEKKEKESSVEKEIFLKILPFFSLILGAYLTYFFTLKAKKEEEKLKSKVTQYDEILQKLQILVGKKPSKEQVDDLLNTQYKMWLYAPDRVVKAIYDLIEYAKNPTGDEDKGNKLLGNVVIEIRKDIGLKTSLDYKYFQYIYQKEDS